MGEWGCFNFNVLGGLFFIKWIFCLLIFFSVFWWNFVNICLSFTHSFTQFFSCTVGRCKCWMVCVLCFGQSYSLLIVFGRFGWP